MTTAPRSATALTDRTEDQSEAIGDGSLTLAGWADEMSAEGLAEFHRRAAERRRLAQARR